MKYVKKVHIKKQEWRVKIHKVNLWYKSPGAIYHIYRFDPDLGRLERLHVYRFDQQFNLTERIDADLAQWVNDGWMAMNGVRRTFTDNALTGEEAFEQYQLPLPPCNTD